jgi:hypothetical protein
LKFLQKDACNCIGLAFVLQEHKIRGIEELEQRILKKRKHPKDVNLGLGP